MHFIPLPDFVIPAYLWVAVKDDQMRFGGIATSSIIGGLQQAFANGGLQRLAQDFQFNNDALYWTVKALRFIQRLC